MLPCTSNQLMLKGLEEIGAAFGDKEMANNIK
jgi:hypothetical protein